MIMKDQTDIHITDTEQIFLHALNTVVHDSEYDIESKLSIQEVDELLLLSQRHEVTALLDDVWNRYTLSNEQLILKEKIVARTVQKSIQLQILNSKLTQKLREAGITAVTLKGYSVSRYFPVPEYRKSGDVDLFVSGKENIEKAVKLLENNGFHTTDSWHANHHLVFISDRNETVELHVSWVEEFKEKHLNEYITKIQKESMNHCALLNQNDLQLYVYDLPYHAFYLLLHMYQHFTASGFGVRNLCDWVVLWEHCHNKEERNIFRKLIDESGMHAFAKAVTGICIDYLGLKKEYSPIDVSDADTILEHQLLRDILDAGEFGYSESERMVGMDGNSIWSYVKEFHHQMHINFPSTGNIFIFWPYMWTFTLCRFLNNNRKLKRSSVSSIMKKAGQRGKLVSRLTAKNQ